MARPSQPDFQKKSSPSPVAAPSQAMAPRPFPPQADVAAPDVQAPDVAAPDAPALDSAPAFPKLNFQLRAAGGSPPPLQPKLTIGAPNDPYEQEADRVAAQVVQRIHSPAANLPTENRTYQAQSVQRQAWPEQPVLKMKSTLQRETLPDEEDELQMKPMLQRLEMPEDDELQMKPMPQRSEMPPGVKLQMKSAFSEGVVEGDASPDLEAGIQRARGNGQSLAPTLQMQMGQAMGSDFSNVRVHTDSQSDQLNRSIQAKAFTTGQDIFFRQGAYQPGNRGGQELIAHELTHVVQQGSAKINSVQKTSSTNSIQRLTEMEEDDWSRDRAAHFMMNKQDGLAGQNQANASIWYNTISSPGLAEEDPNYNADQERVLKEQQAMMKRHFLAQAVFGVQGGKQFKKGKKKLIGSNNPDQQEQYEAIENLQDEDGTSANLATLASGGGRFNYRSEDGSGDSFNNFLMMGNRDPEQTLNEARHTGGGGHGGRQPTTHMGAYQRIGTHGEDFSTGHIQEVDKTTGGIDSTGFDIPIGGVGLALHDVKGRNITTGYQGVSEATRRGRHVKEDTKKYQTGHGFHRHATSGDQSLTQIAFEGSGPHMDNIHGGSHGVAATVGKKVFGGASEKTLTGQDKRSKLGLPGGIGGIKADVTEEGLGRLEQAYAVLDKAAKSEAPAWKQWESDMYKYLLASTTAEERNDAIETILSVDLQEIPD